MKRFRKILVATDTRHDKHPIVDQAVEIAKFNQAALKIIDVVPPFSWLTRYSTSDHEHLSDLIQEEKEEKVTELVESVRNQGIQAEGKVLSGKVAAEICREVIRGEHDLLLAVSKGRNSSSENYFGNTARRLLRQCPCAVWLVAPESRQACRHVLGCVDTSGDKPLDAELNDKIAELSFSMSEYHQARMSLIQAWSLEDRKILAARLSEEKLAEYEVAEEQYLKSNFEKFLQQYNLSMEAENVYLIDGETDDVIESFAQHNGVDLLVIGTVARSGLGGFFIGNTAEKILDRINCSVLAVKPYQFKSSIKI